MAILHTYISKDGSTTDHSYTRGKAIREYCKGCSGYQLAEIRLCTAKDCALYPFRMGKVARGSFDSKKSAGGKK